MHRFQIASPCHESWEAMPGGERVRSCERCQHKVYHLSEMTDTEVTALVQNTEGRLCVRFYQRADGTVLTKDCPVAAGAKRQKQLKRVAITTAGVAAAVAGASGLMRPRTVMGTPLPVIQATPEPVVEQRHATMGVMPVRRPVMGEATPEPRMGRVVASVPHKKK